MIQKSSNSLSTVTNIRFGSLEMTDLWWNVNNIVIPSISLSPPEMSVRAGTAAIGAPDTVDYSELSVDLIVDKEWIAFDNAYEYFLNGLDVESGKFSHYKKFDLWAEIVDEMGNTIKKFWFYNCRLTEISGLIVSPTSSEDEIQTFSLSFKVTYFKYETPGKKYLPS